MRFPKWVLSETLCGMETGKTHNRLEEKILS